MNLNKHFGIALKKFVENNNLNAAGIAEDMGLTAPGFYAYYKSKNPYDKTKYKILDALGITEEQLFESNNEVKECVEEYIVKDPMIKIPQSELLYLLAQSRELSEIKAKQIAEADQKILRGHPPITETSALD